MMQGIMGKSRMFFGLGMILLISILISACRSHPVTQPTIRTQTLTILVKEGHSFKDLDKNGRLDPYEDWRLPVTDRVEDLVSRMTLAEKAGMMMHPFLSMGKNGELLEQIRVVHINGRKIIIGQPTSEAIRKKYINHFNLYGAGLPAVMATWNNNIQSIAEQTRLGIPVTLSSDFRHGFRAQQPVGSSGNVGYFSRWPEPVGLAATGDPLLVEEFGSIANQEYRAVGIRTALHPMATLANGPTDMDISHTFGGDPELAASMVSAYVRGFQGDNISRSSVSCVTKHFPGRIPSSNDWSTDRADQQNVSANSGQLEFQLQPFQAAIRAGTAQIMPFNGGPNQSVPTDFDRGLITGLLREQMGFSGVICTDWFYLPPKGRTTGKQVSQGERYLKALEAGVDQFGGESNSEVLVKLVLDGKVSSDRLTASVRRLLDIKFRLGLFENPYVDPSWANQLCGNKEFQEIADLAQRKSVVLLKNATVGEKKVLPLARKTRIYAEGLDPALTRSYGTLVSSLNEAEVAILRIPSSPRPRDNLATQIFRGEVPALEDDVLNHIRAVMRVKPTIIAFYLEQPAVIPEMKADSAALLAEFGANDEALLDVIFGNFNPTGKLPFHLHASAAVKTRWQGTLAADSEKPLYALGYGLSY